eukprot:14674578-Alexandrium_andersonii.AAC.1
MRCFGGASSPAGSSGGWSGTWFITSRSRGLRWPCSAPATGSSRPGRTRSACLLYTSPSPRD